MSAALVVSQSSRPLLFCPKATETATEAQQAAEAAARQPGADGHWLATVQLLFGIFLHKEQVGQELAAVGW